MSMSEVTITLGRSGQVVKRKRGDSDADRSESLQSATMRHRLGRGVGDKHSSSHRKRLRNRDGSRMILNKDGIKDARLDHKDLRLKLLRKRSSGLNKSQRASAKEQKRSDIKDDMTDPPSRSTINSNMSFSGPELRRNSHTMQFSVRDSGRNSSYTNMTNDYYSSPTTDGSRGRSPAKNSRSFSPPTPHTDFRVSPSMRPSVMSVPQHVLRNEVHDPHRPLQPPPMIAPPASLYRPAAPIPPPNGNFQRSLYLGEPPLSVPGLLHSLGLGKYVIPFQAEEIDITALKQMSEKDLKDIGIPMGPRKKILQAIISISKRPPAPGPPPQPLPPRPL